MTMTEPKTEETELAVEEEKPPEEETTESSKPEEELPEAPGPEVTSSAKSSAIKSRGPETKIEYLNMLIHGDNGSGKTNFCGTMVKACNKVMALVFNEDELMTLDQAGIKGYDYYVITNYEKQLWPLYLSLRRNKPGYDGVFLDGLGDLQQTAKDYELRGDDASFKFMEEAMKGNRRMYLQNWGNLLEMTRHFLDPFLKLPFHKIVTCVSEPDDDPKTGKTKIYPGLQGSLQQLVGAHFSVVGYSYIAHWGSQTYYCLTTQPHEAISTKDRTRLCKVLINPQFKTFLNALDGKVPKVSKKTELEDKLAKALVVRPQSSRVNISESKKKET